eukprot:CAMPEP_0194146930 /NCGR_PEP_ID=MMETSP0152-20130528/22419_1 /TAXON_ID=1049557 /ORGANISM="Thalassiothrix antarctica, Strain L6-D1" /LENGTH=30 /DNA_ID= /DNA_START= /DNA_END= /DNA_ORIENTATION=
MMNQRVPEMARENVQMKIVVRMFQSKAVAK